MENLVQFTKELQAPFDNKGEPREYLRLILPFFDDEKANKRDMMKRLGVDIDVDPSKRNSRSTLLAKLSKLGILKTKPQGKGIWEKGENWTLFMGWIVTHMTQHKKIRAGFINNLYKCESNSIDFIMKE